MGPKAEKEVVKWAKSIGMSCLINDAGERSERKAPTRKESFYFVEFEADKINVLLE